MAVVRGGFTAVAETVDHVAGVARHQPVTYRDGEIALPAQVFDLQTVSERGVYEFVERHFDEYGETHQPTP